MAMREAWTTAETPEQLEKQTIAIPIAFQVAMLARVTGHVLFCTRRGSAARAPRRILKFFGYRTTENECNHRDNWKAIAG